MYEFKLPDLGEGIHEGQIVNVLCVEVADGQVMAVRSVINPDKLRHLGPVADVWALIRERARKA